MKWNDPHPGLPRRALYRVVTSERHAERDRGSVNTKPEGVNTSVNTSKLRLADRHRAGYMATYMRTWRAARKPVKKEVASA